MKPRPRAVSLLNFRPFARLLSPLVLLAASNLACLLGCESTDVGRDEDRPREGATITVAPQNNFTASAQFNIPSVATPVSDLTFTWNNVTTDILCEPVAPATDIGGVWLIRVKGKDQDGVTESIESFSLASDIDITIGLETAGATQAQMLDMKASNGEQLSDIGQFYIPSAEVQYTYMLLFTRGTDIEQDAISMKFLDPVGTGETTVAGEPGCDANAQPPLLQYTPQLKDPVSVSATGPWVADWSSVTTDSQGKMFRSDKLDRVLLAFHAGKTAIDFNQQANFFELESGATRLYSLALTEGRRTSADLSQAMLLENLEAQPAEGTYFNGFDTGGTTGVWLMAVMCDTCSNPAPIILSVLQPPI